MSTFLARKYIYNDLPRYILEHVSITMTDFTLKIYIISLPNMK